MMEGGGVTELFPRKTKKLSALGKGALLERGFSGGGHGFCLTNRNARQPFFLREIWFKGIRFLTLWKSSHFISFIFIIKPQKGRKEGPLSVAPRLLKPVPRVPFTLLKDPLGSAMVLHYRTVLRNERETQTPKWPQGIQTLHNFTQKDVVEIVSE